MAAGLLGSELHPTEGETVTLRSSIVVDRKHSRTEGIAQPRGWESASVAECLGFLPEEIDALFQDKTLMTNNPKIETCF
jgi:hypothetical protein